MRIGFVVDAFCDLPDAHLEASGVRVLPAIVELGGTTWVDDRAPEQTMMLYRRFIADRAVEARSGACSAAEIREIFLQELVLDYDRVLVLTTGADFGEFFARATEASYSILQNYREKREQAECTGSFALRVLDSGTFAAGESVLLCRGLELLAEGRLGFENIRRTLREETGRIVCLVVPGDPWYLGQRGADGRGAGLSARDQALARSLKIRPVAEFAAGRRRTVSRHRGHVAAVRDALGRAGEALAKGLGASSVVLSFGGDPRIVREMAAYQELEAAAAAARIELHLAVMSAAMGARLGPGALCVAWMSA